MIDLPSLALVLGGTLVATLLQAGPRNVRICLAELLAMLRPAFDSAATKADLARQIADMRKDGIVRARLSAIGDSEFDSSTAAMLSSRSLEGMLAAHAAARSERSDRALRAKQVFQQAAELAPVMGLAGTLVSLGTLGPLSGDASAIAGAIGMAVMTTLYGVLLANMIFMPLAGLLERRAMRDDTARQDVFDWLERQAQAASPRLAEKRAA